VNADIGRSLQQYANGSINGFNNLIGYDPDLSNGVNNGTRNNIVGGENGAAAIDAMLAPLGDYGGTTRTQMLIDGSRAIDAGSNSYLGGLTTDQGGFTRVQGSAVDIGAFESTPGDDPQVTSLLDNSADDGKLTLREAINRAFNNVGDNEVTFAVTGTITLTQGPLVIGGLGHPLSTSLVIDNPGNQPITIDGSGASSIFSISWNSTNSSLTINGLNLIHASGAAISVIPSGVGSLSLNDINITMNGGGIVFDSSNGSSQLNITNSTIANNSDDGIDAENGATVTVTGSTISNNQGQGVSLYLSSGTFTNDTISYNHSTGPVGGLSTGWGGATLTDCIVTNNQADSSNTTGMTSATGGVYAGVSSTIELDGCRVTGNVAGATGNSVMADIGRLVAPPYDSGHLTGSNNFIGYDPIIGNGIDNSINGNVVGGENGSITFGPYFSFSNPSPGEGFGGNWEVLRDGQGRTVIVANPFVSGGGDVAYTVISADGTVGPVVSLGLIAHTSGSFVAAMNASGEFVIAYEFQNEGPDDLSGIQVKIYQINGSSPTASLESQVTTAAGYAFTPDSIAIDPAGDFVVAWQTGTQSVINAQAFSSTLAASAVFQVNTTNVPPIGVNVEMNSNGQMSFFWTSSSTQIAYLRRFSNVFSSGTSPDPLEPTDIALSTGAGFNYNTWSLAMDAAGDFVLTWIDDGNDANGDNYGDIFFELFNADGSPKGGSVNTGHYEPDSFAPGYRAVSMDSNGDFVIT